MSAPQGVGQTAILIARVRAQESRRPDRLFSDPYAERFLAAAGWGAEEGTESAVAARWSRPTDHWDLLLRAAIVRTRFLDDLVVGAGCRQVVQLGAGLDTRAFRLDWRPGTHLFEVDLPDMIEFKQEVLAGVEPRCERTVVATDLLADWDQALVESGFRPEIPTVWVAEGLLMYFTAEQNDRLLSRMAGLSAPSSRVGLTLLGRRRTEGMRAQTAVVGAEVTRMWQSSSPEDPLAWLATFGWEGTVHDPLELAASYGRPNLYEGTGLRPGTRGLVTAIRR
ncbi:SAM-dependent methyltransferase [Amycolatopsis sp. RM579]|uniref:S-adenosyl-L-methionine-dependent methyltransferase n=1 Tax=Amycolatopsis pithecellobii TaxID=664692 RepID=A0A6N7ZBN0_9PSEU|nr:SAM-dependent methyltransferase [Amycolatopsis pithecellobii]